MLTLMFKRLMTRARREGGREGVESSISLANVNNEILPDKIGGSSFDLRWMVFHRVGNYLDISRPPINLSLG